MSKFSFVGPYKVDLNTVTNSYWRLNTNQRELWRKTRDNEGFSLASKRGCYTFTNSSKTPLYVGKTDNCFSQECFKEHKQTLINGYLKNLGLQKRCLYIYFVYFTGNDDTDTSSDIDALETALIRKAKEVCKKRSVNLLNTKKVTPHYEIINEKDMRKSIFATEVRQKKSKK